MNRGEGVLVIGEYIEGRLTSITLELLGIGRKLADELFQELSILLMGNGISDLAHESIVFGADKVYLADDSSLEDYSSEAYTLVATYLCQNLAPSVLLLGQTDMGIDIAPKLAARLQVGLSMDCVGLAIDPQTKLLLQTRPVFGGNAHATMVSRHTRPQMATIRAYAMAQAEGNDSREGRVIPMEVSIDPSAIKLREIQRVKQEAEGVRLEDAKIVIAGGYGLGSAENFQKLWELAHLLGGAVGATRPACEEEWVPSSHIVGQTGKIVSPDMYIAVGISGAMQHMAGCSGSKYIIAINNDPNANIFKSAHYGVVADCNEFLPELIEKFRELPAG